jgi:hypothetical protein
MLFPQRLVNRRQRLKLTDNLINDRVLTGKNGIPWLQGINLLEQLGLELGATVIRGGHCSEKLRSGDLRPKF